MQRNPMSLVDVRIPADHRADGRYRWQWFTSQRCEPPFSTLLDNEVGMIALREQAGLALAQLQTKSAH